MVCLLRLRRKITAHLTDLSETEYEQRCVRAEQVVVIVVPAGSVAEIAFANDFRTIHRRDIHEDLARLLR